MCDCLSLNKLTNLISVIIRLQFIYLSPSLNGQLLLQNDFFVLLVQEIQFSVLLILTIYALLDTLVVCFIIIANVIHACSVSCLFMFGICCPLRKLREELRHYKFTSINGASWPQTQNSWVQFKTHFHSWSEWETQRVVLFQWMVFCVLHHCSAASFSERSFDIHVNWLMTLDRVWSSWVDGTWNITKFSYCLTLSNLTLFCFNFISSTTCTIGKLHTG